MIFGTQAHDENDHHHEHSHEHGSHSHGHHHGPVEFNRAFLLAIIANGLFVIFQVIFAYIANSTSLLADAMHNLGDVLSNIGVGCE